MWYCWFRKKCRFRWEIKKLNKKDTSNKLKHVPGENEFKKTARQNRKIKNILFKSFIGQSYFFNDGAQLYLIFQMLYYTLRRLVNTGKIVSLKA